MLYVVELRGEREQLSTLMARVREWLDAQRFEPDAFRCTTNEKSVTCRLEFKFEPEAIACAKPSLVRAGFEAAVAPLGTALTADQLAMIWRTVPEPLLSFDGDGAGQRAAARAALMALPLLRADKTSPVFLPRWKSKLRLCTCSKAEVDRLAAHCTSTSAR